MKVYFDENYIAYTNKPCAVYCIEVVVENEQEALDLLKPSGEPINE